MQLDDIAKKLLDLGKRNRLLNYKDSGLKSIQILNQNYGDIYKGLASGREYSFMLIDPLLEKFHKSILNPLDQDQDDIMTYSPLKVYDITHEACKPQQLIAYKKGYKLDKVLKALQKEYNYSILEKGINSLYISFGFVNYKDEKDTFKAPLLLIPVEIAKINGVYKIHAADDDVILNPTLDYYFNLMRHFDIPDYEKENFDYLEYMESIKAVLPEDVVYEDGMSLGIYSFLKMNMYQDLTSHKDKVLNNSNILALLGNPYEGQSELDGVTLPVVNCDSSQLMAIEMATKGKSFVLQGPPGSGKSQTITNIIASLIGNGRHVLFVSEKLQALQVVYENLKRAGLEEFAIELHSSKANKKAFIENLYKTATLPKYSISNTAEDTKDNYQITKNYVDSYVAAIKEYVENEKITVYELLCDYMGNTNEDLKLRIPNIENHSILESNSVMRNLREYKNAIEPIGYNYKETIFYGFNEMNSSYVSYDLEKEFTSAIQYLNKLKEYVTKLNELLSYEGKDIESIQELYRVFDYIAAYNKLEYDSIYYVDSEKNPYLLEKIEKYISLPTTNSILNHYEKEFLNEDLHKLYRTLKKYPGAFRGFNGEYRACKREILSFRDGKANYATLVEELKSLCIIKNNLLERKTLRNEIMEYLPFISNENMKKVSDELKSMQGFYGILPKVEKSECINPLLDQLISFNNYKEGDTNYRVVASHFDSTILDFYKDSIFKVYSHLFEMFKRRDDIPSFIRALSAVKEIEKLGYLDFLDTYLAKGNSLSSMDGSFYKTFLQNKIFHEIHRNPVLEGFSSNLFRDRISEFNSLDETILRLNRDYIVSVNSMKRPDDVLLEGSKFKILAKEANKVRKQKPVRVLLSEIYDLAITIKPVFLMSPLSVSTYLTEDNQFDCVIFDEASQIFAEDAFGAIYRGKQCIIIGDSKQMPPSNFFGASLENSEDEDDYDSGVESILDMGSSYMPTSSLRWHYRSRSEELIAFSNKAFYDNTLITIPQAKKHVEGFGIDFIYLENGKYDMRTRTNRVEADYISDMVIEHYQKSDKSLGVVAFSKVQAELIEDMVEDKISRYPELQKYFTNEVEEPFFVKNLETVQGDERDRIIFSICYGYNNDGKFYHRFGPLNNLGGERRLNVAVTRSKYNITVVSSIRYTDIKKDASDSVGVHLLRDYLEFAENIEAKKNFNETDNGIVLSLKRFLEENGYEVYTDYGTSSFRIPLVIKEPKASDYLCAIMLDDRKDNRNTTDDNRLEKLLLERQGWKYYKLYSVGYALDPKAEEERLLEFLRTEVEEEDIIVEEPTFIEEAEVSLESNFNTYTALPTEKLISYYDKKGLKDALYEMLKIESPVNKEYFYRRAAEAMGRAKVSNTVKNEVAKNMPEDITIIGNTIWLQPEDEIVLRLGSNRMLNEIPIEEIENGLFTIISMNNGITPEGAYKALIKLLGFSRLTENAKKLLDEAVINLKLVGKIIQKEESLYI